MTNEQFLELIAVVVLGNTAYDRDPEAQNAAELADLSCRMSRRKVRQLFRQLWGNEDTRWNEVAARVLRGDHAWLERGILDMGLTPESFKTQSLLATRAKQHDASNRTVTPGG